MPSFRYLLLTLFLVQALFAAPPTVTIVSGPELTSIDQRPTFTWTGVDADGTVAKYYYSLNDPNPTTETTANTYRPATDLAYGTYTFYLQAEDNSGERSDVSSYIFVVEESPNLLKNGDFSDVLDSGWDFKPSGAALRLGEQCVLSVQSPLANQWDASIGQYNIPITKGEMYEVSFKAKAASATTVLWIVQENLKWTEYASSEVNLTTSMKNYSFRFLMSETTDPEACFFFQFGLTTQQIIVDDMVIKRVTAGNQYKITASVSGNGSISPSGTKTVFEGTKNSYSIQSDNSARYPLVDLIVDGERVDSTYSYTFDNVQSDHSIQAVFGELQEFTITTSAFGNNGRGISSGNDASMGEKVVLEGSSKTFTISTGKTTDDGSPDWSVLKDVIVDGVSMGAAHTEHTFDDISQNHTIVAIYEDRVGTPNLIEWGAWQAQCDSYGSHLSGSDNGVAITLRTDIISNGVASDRMDLTTEGVQGSHPWGQLACNIPADESIKLTGVDQIIIEYAIGGGLYLSPAVVLYDPSMGEGYSYRSPKLSAYGSEVNHRIIRDTIGVSEFTLPDGAPNRSLDLSKVSDILVHTRSINNQGWTWMKPQVYDLRLFGYTGGGYTTSSKKITSSVRTGSGMVIPLGEQQVETGSSKTIFFSPEVGHRVKEVRVNGSVVTVTSNSYTFDEVTADQTIEVDFEPIPTYTIATTVTGGTVLPSESIVVEQGARQRITYRGNAGQTLSSVIVDGVSYPDSTNGFTFDDIQENHTVSVVYEGEAVPTYTVNASFTGAGSITPSGAITVTEGDDLTFTVVLDEDAVLDSLKVGGTKVTPVLSYTLSDIRANSSIAGFASVPVTPTYTISATASGNGSITPEGDQSVNEGGSLQFTFAADAGNRIKSLLIDGIANTDSTASFTFNSVTENHSIAVVYEPIPVNTFSITASVTGNGSITPVGIQSVNEGGALYFTFEADAGNRLKSLMIDGIANTDSTVSYTFNNVTENHTITVEYEAVPTFTITASAFGGGSISPEGETVVTEGEDQLFLITTPEGYLLDSLLVDGAVVASEDSYTFMNVTADATIEAYFTEQTVGVVTGSESQLNLTILNPVWSRENSELPVIVWGTTAEKITSTEVKLFDAVGNRVVNLELNGSDIRSGTTVIPMAELSGSGQYLLIVVATSHTGETSWFKSAVGVKQ